MEIPSDKIPIYNQLVRINRGRGLNLEEQENFPEALIRIHIVPFTSEEYGDLSKLCRTQDAIYINNKVTHFSPHWILSKSSVRNYTNFKDKNKEFIREVADCLAVDEFYFKAPEFFASLKKKKGFFGDIRATEDYGHLMFPYEMHGLKKNLQISVLENIIRYSH